MRLDINLEPHEIDKLTCTSQHNFYLEQEGRFEHVFGSKDYTKGEGFFSWCGDHESHYLCAKIVSQYYDSLGYKTAILWDIAEHRDDDGKLLSFFGYCVWTSLSWKEYMKKNHNYDVEKKVKI